MFKQYENPHIPSLPWFVQDRLVGNWSDLEKKMKSSFSHFIVHGGFKISLSLTFRIVTLASFILLAQIVIAAFKAAYFTFTENCP